MHLYTMHKRDVLLILAGFLATFILLLFIGKLLNFEIKLFKY